MRMTHRQIVAQRAIAVAPAAAKDDLRLFWLTFASGLVFFGTLLA